jgi:hypothetical protein
VAVVQCVRAGGMGRRVWAAREHVDRPEGNDGAGPARKNSAEFDLKRNSKLNTI